MERFRLRVRHEPKRGHIWELHLFPQHPRRQLREADGRVLGSSSTPQAILWLRQLSEPFLLRAEEPVAAEKFGPNSEPRWLKAEDGMRLALAFSAARYLANPHQRRLFREGLEDLPHEVILYWFTLCFYGHRQAAGRAALRTLLTHEEPEENGAEPRKRGRHRVLESGPTLFSDAFQEEETAEPGASSVVSDGESTSARKAGRGARRPAKEREVVS
jgi:hypothetical protein